MKIHNALKLKVFLSRAMDDICPSEVMVQEKMVCDALAPLSMSISNPFRANDFRRNRISGITEIIDDDLSLLARSDILLADLSKPSRSYIGTIIEIAHAYASGKQIYTWVGKSGNENRIWLKYYANAICNNLDDVVEILYKAFTPQGRKENEIEAITYYSSIAEKYDENKEDSSLLNIDAETIKKYTDEFKILKQWVQRLKLNGTILDLGSGTGQWVPIWIKQASHVICVDASSEMLNISRHKNNFPLVEHIQGNFLDAKWLKYFLSRIGEVNVIILGFVLNLLTLEQEKELLTLLRFFASPGTRLIFLENQSSIFSTLKYFSRTEVQNRTFPKNRRIFRIYKRNFISQDVHRILNSFGKFEEFFYTHNYFVSGIAYAGDNN